MDLVYATRAIPFVLLSRKKAEFARGNPRGSPVFFFLCVYTIYTFYVQCTNCVLVASYSTRSRSGLVSRRRTAEIRSSFPPGLRCHPQRRQRRRSSFIPLESRSVLGPNLILTRGARWRRLSKYIRSSQWGLQQSSGKRKRARNISALDLGSRSEDFSRSRKIANVKGGSGEGMGLAVPPLPPLPV